MNWPFGCTPRGVRVIPLGRRPNAKKGTYFEELICTYLRNEATYRDLYE